MCIRDRGSVTAIPSTFELGDLAYVITSATTVEVTGRASGSAVTDISIPDTVTNNEITYSVTTIMDVALVRENLTSVTIPNNVTTIESNAFKDNNLTEVTFMGNFGTFDLNMFTDNSDLTTITYDEDKSGWPVTFTPAGTGSVAVVPEPLPGLPIWLLYQATQ